MTACPICGVSLTEERPRYCAILETGGTTRSTAAEADDSTDDMMGRIHRQLCPDCWEELYGSLTGGKTR